MGSGMDRDGMTPEQRLAVAVWTLAAVLALMVGAFVWTVVA